MLFCPHFKNNLLHSFHFHRKVHRYESHNTSSERQLSYSILYVISSLNFKKAGLIVLILYSQSRHTFTEVVQNSKDRHYTNTCNTPHKSVNSDSCWTLCPSKLVSICYLRNKMSVNLIKLKIYLHQHSKGTSNATTL